MVALTDPVGMKIQNKTALEERLDQIAYGVMDDPIPKGCC